MYTIHNTIYNFLFAPVCTHEFRTYIPWYEFKMSTHQIFFSRHEHLIQQLFDITWRPSMNVLCNRSPLSAQFSQCSINSLKIDYQTTTSKTKTTIIFMFNLLRTIINMAYIAAICMYAYICTIYDGQIGEQQSLHRLLQRTKTNSRPFR